MGAGHTYRELRKEMVNKYEMVRLCTNHFGDNSCDLYPHPPLRNLAFLGRNVKQVLALAGVNYGTGFRLGIQETATSPTYSALD